MPATFGVPTGTTNYTLATASNRLASSTGTQTRTYGFDAAGNTTSDSTRTFVYNDAGRMSSATAGGVTTNYWVNGLGQRVRKSNAATTRLFVYDESGHLLGEYDQAGNLVQETVWLGDIPIATLRPRSGGGIDIFYVHTDHLDTPRKVTRPSDNAMLWRWESDPFGQAGPNEDADGDGLAFVYNLRFPGQYFDAETGLNYNYFRDYDPATGRYPQSDPIGLAGGINTYAYAYDNPVAFFDPDGLEVRYMCRPLDQAGFRSFKHCFVYVTCPEEGWSNVLSLFPTGGALPNRGARYLGTPGRPGLRDDPSSPGITDDFTITPRIWPEEPQRCEVCQFEKAVMARFYSFPGSDVFYDYRGPNSNSFASGLLNLVNWGVRAPSVDRAPGQQLGWGFWGLPRTPEMRGTP